MQRTCRRAASELLRQRERLVGEVRHELFGLGPLEPLLADQSICDILVNSPKKVYIERHGKLELTNVEFKDDEHLMRVIERIVSTVGRRIDESSPMVDARLQDGSRVNAIIPPLALDGPVLPIAYLVANFAKAPAGSDTGLSLDEVVDLPGGRAARLRGAERGLQGARGQSRAERAGAALAGPVQPRAGPEPRGRAGLHPATFSGRD